MKLSAPIFHLKRQARLMARETKIPLHKALDRLARGEGFQSWSHLSASLACETPASRILEQLDPGDLVLLGARPGHGKTLLGLDLVSEAAKRDQRGFFFTLEWSETEIRERLKSSGMTFTLDASDDICADHVIARLQGLSGNTLVVIDYLQLLDQKRRNPVLGDQIQSLKTFAQATGSIIITLSQIHRSFGDQTGHMPGLSDVRLPNPLDLTLFTKTCFLHEGRIHLDAVA